MEISPLVVEAIGGVEGDSSGPHGLAVLAWMIEWLFSWGVRGA